jgi:tetratricopeptide (TPR) repeat protein
MGERLRRYGLKQCAEDPDFLPNMEKSLRVMRPVLTRHRYARELASVAFYYYWVDRYAEAAAIFDEVVAMRPRQEVLAKTLSYLAFCRWRLDDNEGAVQAAEDGIRLLEPLAAAHPGRYGHSLLQARWVLAVGRYHLADDVEAAAALEEYVRMARVAPMDLEPVLQEATRMLVTVLLDLDRPVDALPHAEELVRLLRETDTTEADLTTALERETECQRRAADELWLSVRPLAEEGRVDEARAAGAKALELYRLLTETDEEYKIMTAQVHWYLGAVGEPAERLAHLEQAVATWRFLTLPPTPGLANMFGAMLLDTASCLAENGRDGRAAAEEAVELYRELVRETDAEHTDLYVGLLEEAEATLWRVRGGSPRPGT